MSSASKDELQSGELTLAEFAADLHEVTLGQGTRPIYEDPARFFALTFPTHALRDLVKDVAERLAGRSTKAVRQLELTYGGGKTHALITLYHLFRDPAALLAAPGAESVSEAVADLAGISTSEKSEGARTDWRTLLEKELQIARRVQRDIPALNQREAEQAVVAVFLHSQPIGHKANTPEIVRMIGAGAPDAIDLEKALGGWRDLSWFLDDADLEDDDPTGGIPKSWRLGNRPNLKQMHDEACAQRVTGDAVERRLTDEVHRTRRLTEGARATGAQAHNLPKSPADLGDNGEFRYAVLGPEAASESGKPSAVASRYLAETAGTDKPRVHRNVVVLAVPSRDGVAAAREVIRSLLGWEDVQAQLAGHSVDPIQSERLRRRLEDARRRVPDTIRAGCSARRYAGRLRFSLRPGGGVDE